VPEENKAIIRRFIKEIWNRGHLDALEEFIGPRYTRHTDTNPTSGPAQDFHGIESIRNIVSMQLRAFPDTHFTEEDLLADGDKVVLRWTFRGTHTGPLRGIAPTGKHVTITGITIYQLAEGKIIERWANQDALSLMQQIGALPPLAEA
jgi:predicted ester cyclase